MTDAIAIQTGQLTLDEFIRLYAQEGPFEIINGERVKLMPPVTIHGIIIKRLMNWLRAYEENGVGEAFSELPYVLVDTPDWVKGSKVPDVLFFRAERLARYREVTSGWENKPFILVPDLVVEVTSEHDRYTDINQKVELYLQDGVQLVWVIDPKRRKVAVHQPHAQTTLSEKDALTGGDVIPGFEAPVSAIFNA